MRARKSVIEKEKRMVLLMIYIFGRHHLGQRMLSQELRSLAQYCFVRLDYCQFGEGKGPCKRCPIHCYSPKRRAQIRQIMRWSGPRVFFLAPIQAIRHAW